METSEEIREKLKDIKLDDNIIYYKITNPEDSWKEIIVIHNANRENVELSLPEGSWNVVVDKGVASTEILKTVEDKVTVSDLNTMVLYKEVTTIEEVTTNTNYYLIILVVIGFMGGIVVVKKINKK